MNVNAQYQILEKLPSGQCVWLASVSTRDEARDLLHELKTSSPDGDYVISEGNSLVCTPP